MDMVINAGKSRKNVDAFVLLPPDVRLATDLLIDTRAQVGVPPTNIQIYGFCRPSSVNCLADRVSVCIDEVSSWMRAN